MWAIVANNFTFHYALYVVMNWLPLYFDQVLSPCGHPFVDIQIDTDIGMIQTEFEFEDEFGRLIL